MCGEERRQMNGRKKGEEKEEVERNRKQMQGEGNGMKGRIWKD